MKTRLVSKWNISFQRANGLFDAMTVEMPYLATEQEAIAEVKTSVPDASKFEVFGAAIVQAR